MQYRTCSSQITPDVVRFQFFAGDRCLTHGEVHQLWQEDRDFSRQYSEALLEPGYAGFCWETPPVTADSLDEDHEFVMVRSDLHERIAQDSSAFDEHFKTGELAVTFPNLGRNGTMIAPVPDGSFDGGSIASFLNSASEKRMGALWALVGREVSTNVSAEPLWISTAGLGFLVAYQDRREAEILSVCALQGGRLENLNFRSGLD